MPPTAVRDDHGGIPASCREGLEKTEAINFRHHQVGENQRDGIFVQLRERIFTIDGGLDRYPSDEIIAARMERSRSSSSTTRMTSALLGSMITMLCQSPPFR